MNIKTKITILLGLTSVVQWAAAGDVTGTVTLKGTPPAEIVNEQLQNDATCGKLHTTPPTTHHWVVGSGGGLGNVVVMVKGITAKSSGESASPIVMDQKGCEYSPTIFAVQTGQKIIVKNSDPVIHNIHAQPSAAGNTEMNQAQMPGSGDLTFTFDKPENFLKFKCDVHPWMFAWVTVVENPYFAVTDANGNFVIHDVPPGQYTLVAFHRKAAPDGITKPFNALPGSTKVDFTMNVK